MIPKPTLSLLVGTVAALVSSLPLHADLLQTPIGAMNGSEPLLAHADVTFSTDTITITISNDTEDIHAAGQLVVGLQFTLSTGQTAGSLTSSLGTPLTVNADDTYTLGTPGSIPTWSLDVVSGVFTLHDNGNDNTIIGPPNSGSDLYSNANNSIHVHNPFIASPAVFVLYVPGVTEDTHIDSASILVGTNYTASSLEVTETPPDVGGGIPEPASLSLLAPLGLFLLQRRSNKR